MSEENPVFPGVPARPESLPSQTLRFKPPVMEHSIYLTISYTQVEEEGVSYKRPIEVFLNTKEMTHFQWVSCIMRLLSSVLRREGPFPWFAIEELIETFDPAGGGYIIPKSRGKKANGIVSHIGYVLKQHCEELGVPPEEKRNG